MRALRHIPRIIRHLRRLRQDETGAQLVEFALVLPILLLLFAVTIEGGRTMWAYQSVVAGVRDATRYLARITPLDICDTPTPDVSGQADRLAGIVRKASDGADLFPSGISVTSVTPALTCIKGDYRSGVAPIVEVTAALQITFPFAGIFAFVGSTLSTLDTTVADQSRVYGS